MSRVRDLKGQIFDRLTVLEFSHLDEKKQAYWICQCDCKDKTIKVIKGVNLTSSSTKSCGCIGKERIINMNKTRNEKYFPSDDPLRNSPHKKELKNIWRSMKCRCNSPNDKGYKKYGARGIKICDEWLNDDFGFYNFYTWSTNNGYKEGLTIDRENNDGNYEPDNCRWVTYEVQSNNKRDNINITIGDKTQTIAEWAKEYNINYDTIYARYYNGVKGNDLFKPTDIFTEKEIEINGILHTGKEWSEIVGIEHRALRKRYERGDRGEYLIRKSWSKRIS